jgi:hypothetical protein
MVYYMKDAKGIGTNDGVLKRKAQLSVVSDHSPRIDPTSDGMGET